MVFGFAGPQGADPVYGEQLQDRAVEGVAAEGIPAIAWTEFATALADGTEVPLRRPELRIDGLG